MRDGVCPCIKVDFARSSSSSIALDAHSTETHVGPNKKRKTIELRMRLWHSRLSVQNKNFLGLLVLLGVILQVVLVLLLLLVVVYFSAKLFSQSKRQGDTPKRRARAEELMGHTQLLISKPVYYYYSTVY